MRSVCRIIMLSTILIGAWIGPGAVGAQEPTPPECSAEMLSDALAAVQDKLTEAQALTSDDEVEAALAAFSEAAALMDEIRAQCGLDVAVSSGGGEPGAPGAITIEPVMPRLPEDPLCEDYPQFCVPMAGGPIIEGWPIESPELRPAIDETATVMDGVTNVVRGLSEAGAPFIGDPDAPIHFLEYFDFACPHCVTYEEEAIAPLIEEAVRSGQATFEMRPMAFVAGELSLYAAYAMFCAGEQGTLWEMSDALYAQYREDGAQAYTLDSIQQIAGGLGLDTELLSECITSNRYAAPMVSFNESFTDLGLTATPSMLVRYGPDDEWVKLDDRGLENLRRLVEEANR